MAGTIKLKRIYEAPAASDGTRILVDRLWPRGIAKEKAKIDLWLKDIAPSDALRKRFHGHPEDWDEFRKAYAAELKGEAGERGEGPARPSAQGAGHPALRRARRGAQQRGRAEAVAGAAAASHRQG